MASTKAGQTNSSLTLSESSKILKKLVAGLKHQYWGQDETDLWTARLNSWVREYGGRNVESQADWILDNLTQFDRGIVTIADFKTGLSRSTPPAVNDGPVTMCRLCENTGFYDIGGDRYARCPHPANKQEQGWNRSHGILVPPGESLSSMRDGYLKFIQDLKEMAKRKSMPLAKQREAQ